MRNLSSAIVVILLGSFLLTHVQADECGEDKGCWGAIGTSSNEDWVWATGYWNEQDALNAVEIECGGKCDSWLTFHNTCGAIAEDSERHWGWGYSSWLEDAQELALDGCYSDGGSDCEVLVWACSQ